MVTARHNYQAFGRKTMEPTIKSHKFTGKPVSQTTGLYYYRRWYDPAVGRFISQDPSTRVVSDPQSQNPYVYVRNLPTVLVDPSGALSTSAGGDYLCEGGVGPMGTDTSTWSDSLQQRICPQNPWSVSQVPLNKEDLHINELHLRIL
jgi:RHS repeat-associated protein